MFDKKGEDAEKLRKEHEEKRELLIKKIGEISMDADWLKKTQSGFKNEKKKSLIEFKGSEWTPLHQFELLGLAKSTAYHLPEELKPSKDEIDTKNCIDRIHYKEPSIQGHPLIT